MVFILTSFLINSTLNSKNIYLSAYTYKFNQTHYFSVQYFSFKKNGEDNFDIEVINIHKDYCQNSRFISGYYNQDEKYFYVIYLKDGNLHLKVCDVTNPDNSKYYYLDIYIFYHSGFSTGVFGSLNLKNDIFAVIFFTETNKIMIKLFHFNYEAISYITHKEITLDYIPGEVNLFDFIKIDSERLAYISAKGRDFYFVLFDFYNDYNKMKVRRYKRKHDYYDFKTELAGSLYNGYLILTATVTITDSHIGSLLFIIGYANGTDSEINISPYLINSANYNSEINLVEDLLKNLVIENNIFGYVAVNKIKLISIPEEICFNKGLDSENILDSDYEMKRNNEIINEEETYILKYQFIVKEPEYNKFYEGQNIGDSDNLYSSFQQKIFYGRTNTLKFKLNEEIKTTNIDVQYKITTNNIIETSYINGKIDTTINNIIQTTDKKIDTTINDIFQTTDKKIETTINNIVQTTDRKIITTINNIIQTTDKKIVTTNNIVQTTDINRKIETTNNINIQTTDINRKIDSTKKIIITTENIPETSSKNLLSSIITEYINIAQTSQTISDANSIAIPSTTMIKSTQNNFPIISDKNIYTIPSLETTLNSLPKNEIIKTSNLIGIYKPICSLYDYSKGLCPISNYTNDEILKDIIPDIIESYEIQNSSSLIILGQNDIIFEISHDGLKKIELYNKTNNGLSIIDLGKCGEIIKEKNGLNKNDSLILLQTEKLTNNIQEKNIQYEIYHPFTKELLDLSICNKYDIDIYVPLTLSEDENKLFINLKEYGYDLFDIKDSFYQDICTKYKTENGTDILLADRRNDYYNNNNTCQTNCKYSSYSEVNKYLKCECKVNNKNITLHEIKDIMFDSFTKVLKYSNYMFVKCYKLVLCKDAIIKIFFYF